MRRDPAFGIRFRKHREAQLDEFERPMSQQRAAALFDVSISTIRGWEHCRSYPDERGRLRILAIWPIVFDVTPM